MIFRISRGSLDRGDLSMVQSGGQEESRRGTRQTRPELSVGNVFPRGNEDIGRRMLLRLIGWADSMGMLVFNRICPVCAPVSFSTAHVTAALAVCQVDASQTRGDAPFRLRCVLCFGRDWLTDQVVDACLGWKVGHACLPEVTGDRCDLLPRLSEEAAFANAVNISTRKAPLF
jgi:hypothetical protein